MKKILAATEPMDIVVEVKGKYTEIKQGEYTKSVLTIGDTFIIKAASFTEVTVPDEVYWTVRAAEALGGNF